MPLALSGPSVFAPVWRPNGPALWRVLAPFQVLQERGYPVYWDFIGTDHNLEREYLGLPRVSDTFLEATWNTLSYMTPADVLLVTRQGWLLPDGEQKTLSAGLALMERLKDRGLTLIYETDDDLLSPWIVEQQTRGLLKGADAEKLETERQGRIDALRMCSGATVTSGRLATVLRRYVPNDFPIVVVPNYIDWAAWEQSRHQHPRQIERSTLTVGWIGGGRPDDDVWPMAWAWGQVAQKYPDVRFYVGGCLPDKEGKPSLDATPGMRPILDYLPRQKIIRQGWLDIRRYHQLYRNIDIGCAPLADRPFNRCKTPIKALEYAASASAVVASPTIYKQVVTHGEDGFLCESKEDWAEALKEMVGNASRRRRLARALRRKVATEWSLAGNIWRWPAAWSAIVEAAQWRKAHQLVLATH